MLGIRTKIFRKSWLPELNKKEWKILGQKLKQTILGSFLIIVMEIKTSLREVGFPLSSML